MQTYRKSECSLISSNPDHQAKQWRKFSMDILELLWVFVCSKAPKLRSWSPRFGGLVKVQISSNPSEVVEAQVDYLIIDQLIKYHLIIHQWITDQLMVIDQHKYTTSINYLVWSILIHAEKVGILCRQRPSCLLVQYLYFGMWQILVCPWWNPQFVGSYHHAHKKNPAFCWFELTMLARQNLIVVASKLTIHPVDGAKPPWMLYVI